MSVITLLERAQRINNAMPARMAQRPQMSETIIPEKEFISVKQAKEKFKIPIYLNDDDKLLLLKGDVMYGKKMSFSLISLSIVSFSW